MESGAVRMREGRDANDVHVKIKHETAGACI